MTECGRRSVLGIGALSGVLLATGGCFSLPGSRRQAQDDRFATFTEYVPEGDVFSSVPKEKADEILDVDNMVQDDPNTTDIDQFRDRSGRHLLQFPPYDPHCDGVPHVIWWPRRRPAAHAFVG